MTVPEVDTAALAAAWAGGAVVIDVREPAEYLAGHIPGARNMPLDSVASTAHELAGAHAVYVVCHSGGRSFAATQVLRRVGVPAVNVLGGTSCWARAGRPVSTGPG